MKTIKCLKCGNDKIMNEFCNNCGYSPKKGLSKKILYPILGVLALFYVISLVVFDKPNSSNGVKKEKVYTSMNAYRFAEGFVKDRLKSPKTAEFPSIFEKDKHTTPIGNNKFKIVSWVDSQNSFGALLRSNFSCTIIFKNGKVSAKDLIIE